MAFKNSLKLYLEKDFSPSRAAASLLAHDRSRPSQHPARLASPRTSPAPRWPASVRLLAVAPRRAPDRGRARPPRGGHAPSMPPHVAAGLRPRPRARLLRPKTVRSLAHSRAAFPLRQRQAHSLCLSPHHRTRRRNPPHLLHLGQHSCTRSSTSLSSTSCSRLCRLLSSGSDVSHLATVDHGAAVLGRHGRHLPPLLQPCLATFPPSPSSREPHAPANSPCHGRQWPPASWPSRVAATSQRRRGLCLSRSQAERPWANALLGHLPLSIRSGRACQMWQWAECFQRAGPVAIE